MIDDKTLDLMTRNEADMAFKKRVRAVFAWLDPQDDDVILDGGCGRGYYLNLFRYVSKCRLVGVELDPDILQKAQRNIGHLPDVTVLNASLYALPFADATFDKIILSEVLEHLQDDVAGLREAARVLKPGGVIAVTVPNERYPLYWDPINKLLEGFTGLHISKGPLAGIWANHVRLYSLRRLRRVVAEAGLLVEEERAFTHFCFPFSHNLVYGLGKPLLESGLLPGSLATAADRLTFAQNSGSLLNPINLGLAVLNFFDRPNKLSEPEGRSTVNLAVKARKPG